MALVRLNNNLHPSFNGLFDEIWKDWNRTPVNVHPKVNIREDEDQYVIEMAAPGRKKEDFNIEVDQNVLTISSEMKKESDEVQEKYTKREFVYEAFTRSFTLPETAEGDKIEAKYNDGILSLSIPKKEKAKPRIIKIG